MTTKHKLVYILRIAFNSNTPQSLIKSIDKFLEDIPELMETLGNSNEKMKVKVVLDKRRKK